MAVANENMFSAKSGFSTQVSDRTTATPFNEVPAANDFMLQVRPGLDSCFALSQASALESCVLDKINQAVADNGMDGNTAALCLHALETAIALRSSIGAEA